MNIINLNINCDISFLLGFDGNTGNDNKYIVFENPKKEIEYLVAFSNQLILTKNVKPYIRVKYNWKYGRRPKVIEVVGCDNGVLTLYKKVNTSNFDQHATDLLRIKDEIIAQYKIDSELIKCCLVFDKSINTEIIEELITNLSKGIDYIQF